MKIILVYNAEEGLFNAVTDTIHKVLAPSTYSCSLCRYTYGITGMLRIWRDFLNTLKIEKAFYHRKDFSKAYPNIHVQLPAIFIEADDEIDIALTADDINACDSLEQLMEKTKHRIEAKMKNAPDASLD